MKNKLRLLAVAGIFVATSANATSTITATQLQTFGQAIVTYITNNSSVFTSAGLTAADLQLVQSTYGALATSTQLSAFVNVYNSTLQSSAGCSGMGTYPSINSNNISLCASDMVNALTAAGYSSSTEAYIGAGIAVAYAAGMPLTVGGATVPLTALTTPVTVTTTEPTTVEPTTVAKTVSEVITPQIQRATSIQQATTISNVVSNIFSTRASARPGAQMRMSLGGEKGMAAGDAPAKLNGWFNASDTSIGNSAAASSFSGNVVNALGGVDYMFSPQLVAGASLGFDRVSLNYNFLAGSGLTSTGWMVAPYVSYQINDIVSVDGAYGYASGNADTKSGVVTTTQSYTRNFLALNLNGNYWMGDWQLTGKANYISAEEKNVTTNKMEQLRLGGQVGYWMNGAMPYASITYVNDLSVSTIGTPASTDKDAWVAGIGVNLFSKGAMYGGVSYTEEHGRTDSKNNTLMANIGYRF